ncbi:MAG TPA: MiaB/RimO family radical SAM methylthiotransferase [bacterium]|nr:MiaB/RimO family radical SAM methylthiotransferase [bacterium]
MKYFIETLGCQQNEYDGSRLSFFLRSVGFEEATAEEAGIIFILACSVRQTAVDRVFGRIRNWVGNKKVVVTSCLTPDDQRRITDRGALYWHFGDTKDLEEILGVKIKQKQLDDFSETGYIPIMSGCDNFCSYCIVPYTRGREKSRPINEIINEAKRLIKHGNKEIVLLGQNVNSYKFGFAKLLKKLNDLPGDFKISFVSNHPKDVTEEVINAIAILPKIKKEIHLPLQSGSDKVLQDMNRPYTVAKYLWLVKSLKSKAPKVKITTDIIVGFPTETEKDFQKTVEICKKVGYELAYINKYSPRKGTAAYKLGDPISWQEKQYRWKILNQLINN